jgi:hypothetical protein
VAASTPPAVIIKLRRLKSIIVSSPGVFIYLGDFSTQATLQAQCPHPKFRQGRARAIRAKIRIYGIYASSRALTRPYVSQESIMTDTLHAQAERLPIGHVDGVDFDVVAWGPAQADVDFSVACMFEHELDGAPIAGGLLGLDTALGGKLTALRASGDFLAQPMETLLISLPPATLPARAVLVIGLGQPETLDSDRMRRATRVAMREAIRHGARSMAFAPSVLDGGHTDNAGLDMPRVMMQGMPGWRRRRRWCSASSTSARRACTTPARRSLPRSASGRRLPADAGILVTLLTAVADERNCHVCASRHVCFARCGERYGVRRRHRHVRQSGKNDGRAALRVRPQVDGDRLA